MKIKQEDKLFVVSAYREHPTLIIQASSSSEALKIARKNRDKFTVGRIYGDFNARICSDSQITPEVIKVLKSMKHGDHIILRNIGNEMEGCES